MILTIYTPSNSAKQIQNYFGMLLLMLGLMLTQVGNIAAQNLACNDLVNVSLEGDCEINVNFDLILEDPPSDLTFYEIILEDQNGMIIPGTVLTGVHVGQTIKVRVRHLLSGVSCWGNIFVEDKFPPFFDACDAQGMLPDVTVSCDEASSPAPADYPDVSDNCSVLTVTWEDEEESICGDGTGFASKITRIWTVTDGAGRTGSCTQMVFVDGGNLTDIICPPHWSDNEDDDDENNMYFLCDDTRLVDGIPPVSITGEPEGITCPNIQYQYDDTIFDLCGNGKKILRRWVILDWCAGEEIYCDQIIKVIDNAPPIAATPPDEFAVPRNKDCTVDFEFPKLDIIDCSDVSVEVGYKVKTDGGSVDSPFDSFLTSAISGPDSKGCYSVRNLEVPLDSIWIAYRFTDACGHVTEARNEVAVVDETAPNAICETNTVVALGQNGWAQIHAETFDDHSFDHCSDITIFEVKRIGTFCPGYASDLQYGPLVNFCCEDIARGTVLVMLRVYDSFGNYNECTINVKVQDKNTPVITSCPGTRSINCEADYSNPSTTGGYPTFSSVCDATIDYQDVVSTNECGIGSVIRTWTVTSASGGTVSCQQVINLVMTNPLTQSRINFPRDFTYNACSADQADPDNTGKPTYPSSGCSSVTSGYKDLLLYNFEGNCIKVIREWTVIDWCQYEVDTNGGEEGIWTGSQTVYLTNTAGPVFISDCSPMEFETSAGNCEGWADLLASAQDDCTSFSDIDWRFEIDLNHVANQGFRLDKSGNRQIASDIYPVGSHMIRHYATDLCGNEEMCEYPFIIKETKAPSPICFSFLSFSLSPDGSVEIWASDIEKGSQDNCSQYNKLTYSFSEDTNDRNRTFTCADIPNGVINVIEVRMYVTDEYGNSTFCNANITVSDNFDVCTDVPNANGTSAMIAGTIMSESSVGVEEVELQLYNMIDNETTNKMTTPDGSYSFDQVKLLKDYSLSPVFTDNDPLNGVTTLDIVLIQRYILGIDTEMSTYKMIAADVNKSQSISASDLIELRKLILGINSSFTNNNNWNFIPANHDFQGSAFPLVYDDRIMIEHLLENEMDASFIAVKTGDVNENARYNFDADTEVRSNETVYLQANQQSFKANDEVILDLSMATDQVLAGAQFTIQFDPEVMHFDALGSSDVTIQAHNLGLQHLDRGLITFSWDDVQSKSFKKDMSLIQLKFHALATSSLYESIAINSDLTRAEAYDQNLNVLDVKLGDNTTNINPETLDEAFSISQNVPNPFENTTTIGIQTKESGIAQLTINSLDGRLVFSDQKTLVAGANNWQVNKENLTDSGVYFYTIQIGDQSLTKRMIVL